MFSLSAQQPDNDHTVMCCEYYARVVGYVETPEVTEIVTQTYTQQPSGEYYTIHIVVTISLTSFNAF